MSQPNETKELGKIQSVRVGLGGYQDAQFGVSFTLGAQGWGVGDFKGSWGLAISHNERCEWTEEERVKHLGETMLYLNRLCEEAGVKDVAKLKDVPVEVTFENRTLKSWRILTEVISGLRCPPPLCQRQP